MASTLVGFRPAGESGDEYDEDEFLFDGDNDYSSYDADFTSNKSYKKSNMPKSGFGLPPKRATNGFPSKPSTFAKSQKRVHNGPKVVADKEEKPLPVEDFRNAVMWGKTDSIQTFLDQGIAVDTVLRAGWTALMYASNRGNAEAVQILLDNNADPNYQASTGQYSVLMATCSSNIKEEAKILECVDVLVKHGARVNDFDRYHMSPCMYAAKEGRPLVVQKLVESGADLGKQDNRGFSALSWAASRGHMRVVQVLLEAGADANQVTIDGSKPSDVALAEGHDVVYKVLCDYTKQEEGVLQVMENVAKKEDQKKQTSALTSASAGTMVYGDLELYLSGLQLGELIPIFQEQEVAFRRFLQLTDRDLIQLGVTKIGQRKAILDAIRDTHKKEWSTSSLTSVQYNKQISCPEAVAMVANIGKHAGYMGATIGYMSDQIMEHPDILRSGQEGSSVEELMVRTEEAMANIRIVYYEVSQLAVHLAKVSRKEDFRPPDIVLKKGRKSGSIKRVVIVTAAGMGVVGICIWGRNYIHRLCINLFTRVVP